MKEFYGHLNCSVCHFTQLRSEIAIVLLAPEYKVREVGSCPVGSGNGGARWSRFYLVQKHLAASFVNRMTYPLNCDHNGFEPRCC